MVNGFTAGTGDVQRDSVQRVWALASRRALRQGVRHRLRGSPITIEGFPRRLDSPHNILDKLSLHP
ncbi:MAG: hypothetical protein IT454_10665 [Planctomycetes bacterium]|nr:hypothetical protein [Planctomycetota bacterium]